MGSAVKRGKDTDRVSAKERPSSRQKSTNKITIIFFMLFVAGSIMTIAICMNLESSKAIKELEAGLVIMIPALVTCLGISIQPKLVNAIKKSKIAITLCGVIGVAAMLWIGRWIKGVWLAEAEEREKKEAIKADILTTDQEVAEVSVTLI